MSSNTRRNFLQKTGIFSVASLLSSLTQPAWSRNLESVLQNAAGISAEDLASEEEFWYYIRQSFTVSPAIINLNNGGVSPAPKTVQHAMKRYYDLSNEAPSYYMWHILDQGREPLRRNLAGLAGCDPEEIAIQRNASEALETIIFGIQLKAGDEVVASPFDYPNMVNAYKQREIRDGIKIKWVELDLPNENDEQMVRQYVNAFTSKTKIVHLTHVLNRTGQIIPVRKIAEEAHKRNIEVVVDGAHSLAHIDYKIPDLQADYYGASLHKWLYAPIGSGLLYIKKDKIKSVYPLFATSPHPLGDNIRKFESLGTRPFFIEQAIGQAIEFHDMIGSKRKEKRLFYLKNYWLESVKELPGIRIYTSLKPQFACGIAAIGFEGKDPAEISAFLFEKYKIHLTLADLENIHGIRITPNVYTTTKELDVLVNALSTFAKK